MHQAWGSCISRWGKCKGTTPGHSRIFITEYVKSLKIGSLLITVKGMKLLKD